jgi:fatty-acyl-CoA synthase
MFDGDLLSERARVTPDKLALVSVETGERLTYADLDARAERAAAILLANGINPGDRVGLLAFNCTEFIELFFGAGKAGAIVVPLSTRATAHELEHIARDCGMTALLFGEEFAAIAGALSVVRFPLSVLRSSHVSALTDNGQRATDNESVACLLYTSGTTGKPKGVMIPRRQLLFNGYNTALNWDLRADDVSSIFTPLYHAGGIAAFMIPIFCAGGTIVIHKGFNASEVWQTIEQEKCSVVLGVPTIWKLLMEASEFASVNLDHVRWFISGGAPLPQFIIDAYQRRGVPFKQGYGMTEVGVNCFTMTVDESYRKPGSIGRPMLFTSVKLMAGDREAAPNEVGEMYIRGPHVSLGYWNNEAATRASYSPDGWFRTGDLARRDEEGFFYIAGRLKEMFISGGVNVYPAEIEAELVAHPSISDAAVIAVPDETWGEVGIAFIVGQGMSEADIAAYLTMRIAKYKVPRRFVFVEALPRTPYGKVVKDELRKQLDT